MITSRINTELHAIDLDITGAPQITDAFGEKASITGVRITYKGRDREVSAVRFKTADDNDLFVSDEDMASEKWPTWLRELVEQYRPVEPSAACPECSAPAVGDRFPTHDPRCPWNDPNF